MIPALYHYFRTPLPYAPTLALQERIHQIQLLQRKLSCHKDILLLLQHRPVYTSGRRQTEESTHDDRVRLTRMGADFIASLRGGELTYHGPGQIVGYPLLDLSRSSPPISVRDYVCRLQHGLEQHLLERHGIRHAQSEHTGVFLDAHTKIASIGVQVRHRLTTHGFAINITNEPRTWFDQVVACGLADVSAGSVEGVKGEAVDIHAEIPPLLAKFGSLLERDFRPMVPEEEGEIGELILAAEEEARKAGPWPSAPRNQ
ncbi:Coatomer protein [Mycena indigotica]|uniref:lipoyl(octanoyl) transferase n=1 Tax=Mycena indigotica TaxID=2126181 RepID=A0A8H6SAE3_9AGAR|nr:Coatomer protein [Mycena indigotica]KAF7294717.1 Coatomer protein [Mycena indigotica]